MKKPVAVWLTALAVFAWADIAPTPPCQAGPVLTTPAGLDAEESANTDSSDARVHFAGDSLIGLFTTLSTDKLRAGSLPDPIDEAVDGNRTDAFVWTVTDVSGTAALHLGEGGRPRYINVSSDIYSSNYWHDATIYQSNASENGERTISEPLKVAAEIAERSKFVLSIICGSKGHFP